MSHELGKRLLKLACMSPGSHTFISCKIYTSVLLPTPHLPTNSPHTQHTAEQEELLRPISTVLKAVDGLKSKMDAITEEIEGIEKVHHHIIVCVTGTTQQTWTAGFSPG